MDTNILVYAANPTHDAGKHGIAVDILARLSLGNRGLLPMQALTEFYTVVTRKVHADPGKAKELVEVWGAVFPPRSAEMADLADAMRVHRDHGISFWDGMIWAVSRRAGAAYLLSEDLQDGRELEGVRFVNPFNPANQDLLEHVLAF
ncbi:PIN domain-containing protein [Aerophototrophica crusticola]|uniref:PIN domain-containing protein n=1 Tax=Aerophototrophica crusticola TaxID=1709002 RepID=A0A858RAG9_9PROT|nr:PIN domain-containing protein [Rhodospirillaceae bacterium B3]